jgi:hypothetical protein
MQAGVDIGNGYIFPCDSDHFRLKCRKIVNVNLRSGTTNGILFLCTYWLRRNGRQRRSLIAACLSRLIICNLGMPCRVRHGAGPTRRFYWVIGHWSILRLLRVPCFIGPSENSVLPARAFSSCGLGDQLVEPVGVEAPADWPEIAPAMNAGCCGFRTALRTDLKVWERHSAGRQALARSWRWDISDEKRRMA